MPIRRGDGRLALQHLSRREALVEEGAAGEGEHAVTPRPPGVWWARTAAAPGTAMCERPDHAVYRRRHTRRKVGHPDEVVTVDVYACAVCWPRETGQ